MIVVIVVVLICDNDHLIQDNRIIIIMCVIIVADADANDTANSTNNANKDCKPLANRTTTRLRLYSLEFSWIWPVPQVLTIFQKKTSISLELTYSTTFTTSISAMLPRNIFTGPLRKIRVPAGGQHTSDSMDDVLLLGI